MFRRNSFHMTIPIVAMSCILFLGAAATGWYVHSLQQDASNLLSRALASMRAAEEIEIRTREMRTRLNQFLLTGDPRYFSEVPELHEQLLDWLTRAEQLVVDDAEREMTSKTRAGLSDFWDGYQHLIRRADSGAPTEELKAEVGRLIDDKITVGILVHAHQFLDVNQEAIQHTIPANQQAADRMGLGMVALGFLGSLAGVMIGVSMARQFSESLVRLTVPVRDAAGKLNEVVGPIELSTSADNMEELNKSLESLAGRVNDVVLQLQRSQREALRAEQLAAVGQLAAGMAHELRNPLTAIKMIVQSAVEGQGAAGISGRALEVLYEQILRQEHSITGFLEFARPPRLEPHQFDLCNVLRASVLLLSEQGERQGVSIESMTPDGEIRILGDSAQVGQVIVNLIINAVDALPDGGQVSTAVRVVPLDELIATTTLHPASNSPSPTGWALLTVTDNGPGLPVELAERIFDPFISTKETGMGLGLSICKRIVELHGGQITATNNPHGGATFYVAFPQDISNSVSSTISKQT
ncbi:MAG: ATP-binding protein [Planctomycetaceae bacterium]